MRTQKWLIYITMASTPDDLDAQRYFTEAEWNSMVTLERNRINNMLRNYKCLLAEGINAKPPDFIARHEKRRKQELTLSQVNESEANVHSSESSSGWDESQEHTSYDPLQKGDSDSSTPEVILGIEQWGDAPSAINERSDFCQYCYISKQLNYEEAENNPPSVGDCLMGSQSEVPSLQFSNIYLGNNSYGCHTQSPLKPKVSTRSDEHKSNICCQVCGLKFAKLKYLKNHIKRFSTPDENRPFKCLFCSHTFIHEKNRKYHERVHNNKLIHCCHCSQSFVDLTTARIHIDKTHQNKVHVCKECGMNYSSSSHLHRHKREVRKEFPHECFVCGHRYMTAIALTRHEAQHLREKPFKCKVCLKTFSSKTQLTKHVKSQIKEKRFECSSCKVTFMAQKSLKKHERLFNGDRPFKCTICGHAYNKNARLAIHMKVHDKERQKRQQIYM